MRQFAFAFGIAVAVIACQHGQPVAAVDAAPSETTAETAQEDSAAIADTAPAPGCATAADCKGLDVGPCVQATCDAATHACKVAARADGQPCQTVGACSGKGVCQAGACAVSPPCGPVACKPKPIACGQSAVVVAASLPASQLAGYGCASKQWTGPEQAFVLASDATQVASVTLAMTATFTLFDLTPNEAGLCAPNKCIATGSQLLLGLQPGRARLLVVESMGGGEATLMVSCQPLPGGCGDKSCSYDLGETCANCAKDCGACKACPASTGKGCAGNSCQDCVCAKDSFCCSTTWDDLCAQACTKCNAPLCGDAVCSGTETCATCPVDCGGCDHLPPQCGDGVCDPLTEHCASCPADCKACGNFACVCQTDTYCCNNKFDAGCQAACTSCANGPCPQAACGDGLCWGAETCASCAKDCGACPAPSCGDGKCNGQETCATCPAECGKCPDPVCGDDKCESGETAKGCPKDCGPAETGCKGHCTASSKDSKGATCWCDATCATSGDCCADKANYCP